MIRRLRGELVGRGSGAVEVVTGDGVGYEVNVPLGLADRLPSEGGMVELHTVLVVRDDAFELYGFESALDRELFQRLRVPSGVGPRLALAILGALPPERVVRAIRAKDHRTLQTVSGVGRKTAERIAIELADKLDDMSDMSDTDGGAAAAGAPVLAAVKALRGLGYPHAQSENAVHRALESLEGREVDAEELVRHALRHV
ncbi:Holliday junction branch migration protein RuvA [Candidatus Palauibacter sp.]|uniref:Holliday junction branch migration protein RuvA n=1 Tax=Candidatus Palauibacter sp. TaxID=3101350 RepID=UPI003B595CB6